MSRALQNSSGVKQPTFYPDKVLHFNFNDNKDNKMLRNLIILLLGLSLCYCIVTSKSVNLTLNNGTVIKIDR